MLKVEGDGVTIHLNGKGGDPLFVWSMVMLVLAVLVAVACFTLPVPYAIGSVAALAVVMYFFNQKKHAAKTIKHYHQGTLTVRAFHFNINGAGLSLTTSAQIEQEGDTLSIQDRGLTYRFSGFEGVHEIDVAKKVLMGQRIKANEKTIRFGAS